jgi:hypothetical protein
MVAAHAWARRSLLVSIPMGDRRSLDSEVDLLGMRDIPEEVPKPPRKESGLRGSPVRPGNFDA